MNVKGISAQSLLGMGSKLSNPLKSYASELINSFYGCQQVLHIAYDVKLLHLGFWKLWAVPSNMVAS